jgi:hypothetical protein
LQDQQRDESNRQNWRADVIKWREGFHFFRCILT